MVQTRRQTRARRIPPSKPQRVKKKNTPRVQATRAAATHTRHPHRQRQQRQQRQPQHTPLPSPNAQTLLAATGYTGPILCREEQQAAILTFLQDHVRQCTGGGMYVCGSPGTGKTLSVDSVLSDLEAWERKESGRFSRVVVMNAARFPDRRSFLGKILESVILDDRTGDTGSSTGRDAASRLQDYFTTRGAATRMTILVVDEVDQMVSRGGVDGVQELFSWPALEGSSLLLIGIANAIDLADRLLPRLAARRCKPEVVYFPPYTSHEIVKVVKKRLGPVASEVIEDAALEMCARKVEKVSGDMRKALEICRRAVASVETTSVPASVVSVAHIITSVLGTPIIATIRGLPQHQQLILLAAVRWNTNNASALLDTTQLYNAYHTLCKSPTLQVPNIPFSDFLSACHGLVDSGLMAKKDPRCTKVTVAVTVDDVRFALGEQHIYTELLSS